MLAMFLARAKALRWARTLGFFLPRRVNLRRFGGIAQYTSWEESSRDTPMFFLYGLIRLPVKGRPVFGSTIHRPVCGLYT